MLCYYYLFYNGKTKKNKKIIMKKVDNYCDENKVKNTYRVPPNKKKKKQL